jgi:diguanylate cyclase (GGDEF)-like protein
VTTRLARGEYLVKASVLGGAVLLAVFVVFWLGGWGDDRTRQLITDFTHIPFSVLATLLGLRIVHRRSEIDGRTRRAWIFITVAYACAVVADTAWFIEDGFLGSPSYPAFADYWFLAFTPFMFAGLLLMPGRRRTRLERHKLLIDSLIVGASTFSVLWYLVIGPTVQTDGGVTYPVVFAAAIPVGDLLLVLALATLLMRRPQQAGAALILVAGVSMYVVGDVAYTYISLHSRFSGGTWPDLFWLAGGYLFALSTYFWHKQGRAPRAPRTTRGRISFLPYVAGILAYALLGFLSRDTDFYPLGGVIVGAIVLTMLIIARQMYALRENRLLALTDPLTGLANRILVNDSLAQLAGQAPRENRVGAVLLIDLDHFKPINDEYGHEAGDAVLVAVATALRAVIRSGDIAARTGGDEFAVVLNNLPDRAVAERIAQRLIEALRTPVIFGDVILGVEASIGLAFHDGSAHDGDQLLAHADTAMYVAKRSGRGRYRVFTAEMDTGARDSELRRAVHEDELVVHFQPVVDVTDGRITGFEALVRWQHPQRGLLMPGAFIDLAEETGAILEIGQWVLREACRQVAGWRATIPVATEMHLNVNLSPRQVTQSGLVADVRRILDETGFPADRLVLEITEGVALHPDEQTVARLTELCDMGIKIAVDDFGTGYAALSYLRQLPVSILKIDRSFVTGIDEDPQAYAIAEALVRLGRAFHLHVVAEGIETTTQAARLDEMGCRYAQGYLFHRPQPGPQIIALLSAPDPASVAG